MHLDFGGNIQDLQLKLCSILQLSWFYACILHIDPSQSALWDSANGLQSPFQYPLWSVLKLSSSTSTQSAITFIHFLFLFFVCFQALLWVFIIIFINIFSPLIKRFHHGFIVCCNCNVCFTIFFNSSNVVIISLSVY